MPHPRLETFFNGAADDLRAAYTASAGASSSVAGSMREERIRSTLTHVLPASTSLYSGEIIDAWGGQSGQLDGILVHGAGAAVAITGMATRVVLAEGALAVVESKSDICGQWAEVLRTWHKASKLRRFDPTSPQGIVLGAPLGPSEAALPFVEIGRRGWKSGAALAEKATELFDVLSDEHGYSSPCQVVQLDPPGLGYVVRPDGGATQTTGCIFPEEQRWRTIANVWAVLAAAAQRHVLLPVQWARYLL